MLRENVMRWTLIACGLLIATSGTPPRAGAEEEAKPWGPAPVAVERQGEHYRVLCHFDTSRIADEVLAAVEPVWDATVAVLGRSVEEKGRKDVHLYRGAADFLAADKQITGGQFARNLAFTAEVDGTSHIALQPEMDDTVFARVGVSAVTLRTAAHEAAHGALYQAMPNHDDQPQWLSEGLAIWIADTVLVAHELAPRADLDPMSSTRMVRVQRLLAGDVLPTPREIIFTKLDNTSFNDRYAVWSLFFRFLSTTRDAKFLRTLIDTAWRTGGGNTFDARLAKSLEEAWGKATLDALDKDFKAYVRALRPAWDETSRTLGIRGNTWTQMAWNTRNTAAWRVEPVGRAKFAISGSVEILYGTNPQMNVLLARHKAGFVTVAFRADAGVTILDYRSEGEVWRKVGWMDVPEVRVGNEVKFRIRIDGDQITLDIADHDPLVWTLEDVDVTGSWGVGAQYSSAGIWRGVKLH